MTWRRTARPKTRRSIIQQRYCFQTFIAAIYGSQIIKNYPYKRATDYFNRPKLSTEWGSIKSIGLDDYIKVDTDNPELDRYIYIPPKINPNDWVVNLKDEEGE